MAERRRERELGPCVHIPLVIIFQYDHLMISKRSPYRMAHTNIHPPISADHDKGDILVAPSFSCLALPPLTSSFPVFSSFVSVRRPRVVSSFVNGACVGPGT